MAVIRRDGIIGQIRDYGFGGAVKILTGVRGSGKTFLLFNLYREELLRAGVPSDHIIEVRLEQESHFYLRDAEELTAYVMQRMKDKEPYYLFVDDVLHATYTEEVLNGFLGIRNLDVTVTSRRRSRIVDGVATEFRGRGIEIPVYPLSYAELVSYRGSETEETFLEYLRYGGLPAVVMAEDPAEKERRLRETVNITLADIAEAYGVRRADALGAVFGIICSLNGDWTNANRIEQLLKNGKRHSISFKTIDSFIRYFEDFMLVDSVRRFDVKTKRLKKTPNRYVVTDTGLAGAGAGKDSAYDKIGTPVYVCFRRLGWNVFAGFLPVRETDGGGDVIRGMRDVDYVADFAGRRVYVQICPHGSDVTGSKRKTLAIIRDSFPKITVVTHGVWASWDEDGIRNIAARKLLTSGNFPFA